MALSGYNIQNKLNSCALIARKYNLGDKAFFFSKFLGTNLAKLETAWNFGFQTIQNRGIIKDASGLHSNDLQIITNMLTNFDTNQVKLYYYLNSEFYVKKLKLSDENIERNLRQKLAIHYIQLVSDELFEFQDKAKKTFKNSTTDIIKN